MYYPIFLDEFQLMCKFRSSLAQEMFFPNSIKSARQLMKSYEKLSLLGSADREDADKLRNKKKAKVLERILEGKKLLLDRGFNATYIETEEIHLKRRYEDAILEHKLKEWAKAENDSIKTGRVFCPPILASKVKQNIDEKMKIAHEKYLLEKDTKKKQT